MIVTITKSGPLEGAQMHELFALAKGLIEPGELSYGGTVPPQQASKIIDMVFEDPFLSKITTQRMMKLQMNVEVLGAEGRQMVRVAEGVDPSDSDLASAFEAGDQFNALPAQLFYSLGLTWLRAHQTDPKLLKKLEGIFIKVMQRDFVDLGFNGLKDDASGDTREERFFNLNKGWIQLAKEAEKTPKLDIDPITDTWLETLKGIKAAANGDYRSESQFVMNTADADAYAYEINGHVTGRPLAADDPLRRFDGIQIHGHDKMPRGHVLFTPMYNLAFGLHDRIERTREFVARKRALEFTFDQAFDYQIAVKQACVLGKPADA